MADVPAISVVIPLYNKGSYIARAINSVLAQTFQDFEVIVVDDGSTDDGAAVIKQFDDPRIQIIQQENMGVSAARNRGIEAARAELVAFLDADDEWLPDFLVTIVNLEKKYPTAAAFATGVMEIRNGKRVTLRYKSIPKMPWDGLIPDYFKACFLGPPLIRSSSVAIRKQILKDLSGFKEGVYWGEDQDLWGRIALKYQIAFTNKVYSVIHIHVSQEKYLSRVKKTKIHPFIQTAENLLLSDLSNNIYLFLYIDSLRINSAALNLKNGDLENANELLSKKNTNFPLLLLIYLKFLSLMPREIYHKFNNYFYVCWEIIFILTNTIKKFIALSKSQQNL